MVLKHYLKVCVCSLPCDIISFLDDVACRADDNLLYNHCGMTMNIRRAHTYSLCIRCHGEKVCR
jgi:hypothetical protein